MEFFSNFCRNMSHRSYQYMIRSTYSAFDGKDLYYYKIPKEEKKKERNLRKNIKYTPLDKNGKPIREGVCVSINGKKKVVRRTTPKMVVLSDGSKHKADKVIALA